MHDDRWLRRYLRGLRRWQYEDDYYDYDPNYSAAGYYGWYEDFYYPGAGYYVYERGGARHRWSDRHRKYWESRRGHHEGRENWSRFRRDGDRDGRRWRDSDRDGDGARDGRWGRNDGDRQRDGRWGRNDGDRQRDGRWERNDGDGAREGRDGTRGDGEGGRRWRGGAGPDTPAPGTAAPVRRWNGDGTSSRGGGERPQRPDRTAGSQRREAPASAAPRQDRAPPPQPRFSAPPPPPAPAQAREQSRSVRTDEGVRDE